MNFPNIQYTFFFFLTISEFRLFFFLQRNLINERALILWRNHSEGVLNSLIDNLDIFLEGVDDAALRLRRRFMPTGYEPRDVPESATNVSSDLNDSIHVLNFIRSECDIT